MNDTLDHWTDHAIKAGWISQVDHNRIVKERIAEFSDVLRAESELDVSIEILNKADGELYRMSNEKLRLEGRPDLTGTEEPASELATYFACIASDAADSDSKIAIAINALQWIEQHTGGFEHQYCVETLNKLKA